MKKWTKNQFMTVCKDFVIYAYQNSKSLSDSQLRLVYSKEHFILCTLLLGYFTISDQKAVFSAIKELDPLYKLPFQS